MGVALVAAVAFAVGLYCLVMPVRHLGYNPYKRRQNPGFDASKAAENMWIVRLIGVGMLVVGGAFVAIAVATG